MSVIQKIRETLPTGETEPNRYKCTDCGREFEEEAPPERTICSVCGNTDVKKRTE
jgi:DNA-directed RNA polymerase subunit RPC12/RpoP